jgi:S1-C subfamily serine protease
VEGMRIAEVTAGGPAERAGLHSGDVVVRFGTTPVRSVRDYMVGLEKAAPGQEVEVEFLRAGKRLTAKVLPITLISK